MCVCVVGSVSAALGMQSQAIVDCQLSASESPVAGQQAKHARLGGPSGRHLFTNRPALCVCRLQPSTNDRILSSVELEFTDRMTFNIQKPFV